jgi:hypothetical protein
MTESSFRFRTLDLPGGGLVPFFSAPGERVRILYGRVWLTEEGRPDDAFLASGEEVRLDAPGLVVIEALGPARVQLYEEKRGSSALSCMAAKFQRRATAWLRSRVRRGPGLARGTVQPQ